MIELKDEVLESLIKKSNKVIIDFHAKWCGPCRLLEPIFKKVSENNKDKLFIGIDIDDHEKETNEYHIMSVPTIIILENGKEIKRNSGFISEKALEDLINY